MSLKDFSKESNATPELRFPEFDGMWEEKRLGEVSKITMGQSPDSTSYNNLHIGLPLIQGNADILNRVSIPRQWTSQPMKICELDDILLTVRAPVGAVGKSQHKACIGRGISAIRNKEISSLEFLFQLLLWYEPYWIKLGQGSTFTAISGKDIKNISFFFPSLPEQTKIAAFLSKVDEKIEKQQSLIEQLEQLKKGYMQQLFSQKIRFNYPQGNPYSKWEKRKLNDILLEHKLKNTKNQFNEVFSVSKEKGVINQIEHLGRSYAAESVIHYKLINPYDIVYTKSPTNNFPYGIIKQNRTGRIGIVSPLYGVFSPENQYIGFIIHSYFLSWVNTYNYLNPLIHKGAKNTMNINNDVFLGGRKLSLPHDIKEQVKLANFLSTLDKKIETAKKQLEATQTLKKALLQKMFV